jgi:mannose-6-phosphate isomerase-like protein (cupin superfamily)
MEYFGRVNSKDTNVSIAFMKSPEGWIEPGQTPEFDEYTVVTSGTLCIKTKESEFDIKAGEAVCVSKNEWVQYSSPYSGGAEYIAVCLPAFSPDTVNRDPD